MSDCHFGVSPVNYSDSDFDHCWNFQIFAHFTVTLFEPEHDKMMCAPSEDSDVCTQRRLRSAWASALFDQSLCCPHEETLGPLLPIERTVKTLIAQADLSLRWVHTSFCWFCHAAAHLTSKMGHSKTSKILCHAVILTPCVLLAGRSFGDLGYP